MSKVLRVAQIIGFLHKNKLKNIKACAPFDPYGYD